MDLSTLTHALLSTQSPLLPQPGLARVYLSLGWGLVLACAGLGLLRRGGVQQPLLRLGLPALLVVWCAWPGPGSPAWWLGLAFRTPSLLAALLCGWALLAQYTPALRPLPVESLRRWALLPVLLGWLLLLDTFAVWPVSLYALGYAPVTLGLVALVCLMPWLLRGAGDVSLLLMLALVLQVGLRLPSGNVWDALIDPWLWLLLQTDLLLRLPRRWRESQAKGRA
jgi:hypothetical protein